MNPSATKTLAQTTVNSLGQPIAYPQGGTPEVTALLVEMAPGEEFPWHQHPVPLLGYILSGALTVYQVTGEKRIVRAGEVSLESVNVIHRGVNEGAEPCRMIVFVLGLKNEPHTVASTEPGTVSPSPGRRIWPILVLAAITPVLTELLSGNIQAPTFFLPWTYGMLLLAYGIPVLLARELFVRWNLGLPGLFLLGLAYGIFNEGILAKTLLKNDGVPMDAFDHHAWLGINFPWAALIVPWHACHAIIYPIALVSWWFPAVARTSWLSRKTFIILAGLISVLGTLAYLGNKRFVSSPAYLIFFIAVMAGLIFAAKRIRQGGPFLFPAESSSLWPAAAGFTFYPVLVLGPTIVAGLKAPGIVLVIVGVLVVALYYRLLVRRSWLGLRPFALFALGDYFAGSLWTSIFMLQKHNLFGVPPEIVLMALFAWGIIKLAQK